MANEEVIRALEAAVAAAPHESALRLHLAELLSGAGEHGRALEHVRALLASDPGNVPALRLFAALNSALGGQALDAPSAKPPEAGVSDPQRSRPDNVVQLSVLAGGRRAHDEDSPFAKFERPALTLADVAGMETVKERLWLSFLGPLEQPELRRLYGKKLRGGLLLYGPPGCGKTFIARAVAGEMGARFFSVSTADVLSKWVGESEQNVQQLFQLARRNAPCVVFLDEIDAIGHKRGRDNAAHSVVNQLLTELDSVDKDNQGIFVLAATNHPWDVDAALRRPGRLDRAVLVTPPDRTARQRMLELSLETRPVEGVDLGAIADKTPRYSGADLAHLVDSAAELAMADAIASGRVRPIGKRDFARALEEVRPTTQAWFDTAKNYALYANDGGQYDDLLLYLKRR